MALRRVAVERDAIPERLRIHAPAEMRYRIRVTIVRRRFAIVQPVAHQFSIVAVLYFHVEPVADREIHRVGDVAAIRQYDYIAWLQDDRPVRAALVRERMNVAAAPVIEVAALVRVAPLRHHRVLAALVGEIGACLARDVHALSALVERLGVLACFLEAGGRHQLLEIVRRVDDHQHARATVHHLLQPLGEERHVEDDNHVRRAYRFQRACALADGRHAHLGPRRQGIDAELVDVGAEVVRRREGGLDVLPPRGEIAHDGDRLAFAHFAQLQFPAIELPELRRVDLLRAETGLHHARIMARQIWCGVAGICKSLTPYGASASRMAVMTAAGAAMAPDSPQPLAPSGLWVHGWLSSNSDTKNGTSVARGNA